ncbi:5'-methylthioadenosine/S-adenosylhomocysteine nucleosidase family protein [Serratia fonticola]|uniref:5'-methylthioadenosine/S-adenosylhomocysteine nucleosidase family protein n=1 Tax=Serratia fonticola TaxID=47917 RepID=UPI003AF3D3C7
MKVLLVEDNYDKYPIINKTLGEFKNVFFTKVVSAADAIRELSQTLFDVMIIDIQIPDIDGGEINPTGGLELLQTVENLSHSIIPRYIMGLTSNTSDVDLHLSAFKKYGWPLFDLKNDSVEWKELLTTKAQAIENNANYICADIAIITALEDTELEELLKLNPSSISHMVDGYRYYFYELPTVQGVKLRVVSTSAEKMGVTWSSQVATRVIEKFKPKMLFMTGICAGVSGKSVLGDIIVGDPVWDWGAGKISEDEHGNVVFLPEPHQISINRKVREGFRDLSQDHTFLKSLALSWPGITTIPNIKIAPMACGSSVIANQTTVDDIADKHRKVTAIEMESYAVMAAASSYNIYCAVIKSVCDLGDKNKSDNIQNYCAYASASVAIKFIAEKMHSLS